MQYETPALRWLTMATDVIMNSDETAPDKDTDTDDEEYFGDQNKDFIWDGWHDLLG